jgi:hypothetical protein
VTASRILAVSAQLNSDLLLAIGEERQHLPVNRRMDGLIQVADVALKTRPASHVFA